MLDLRDSAPTMFVRCSITVKTSIARTNTVYEDGVPPMFSTPAQFSELQKSQLDAIYALSQVAFTTTEKLVELNLAAMKAAMDESAATTQSMLGIKDAQDMINVGGTLAQPALHKVVGYSRNYY